MSFSLPKAERLCGKTSVSGLAKHGKWLTTEHLKCCWAASAEPRSRILVSVPKRFFKRAVKRNLLKRRIREAYRLQKDALRGPVDFMICYNHQDVISQALIYEEVGELMNRISK